MTEIIRVAGLRELREALLQLPKRVDRRVLNAALMAGGRIIAEDARARAPELKSDDRRRTKGLLRRSIRARPGRPLPGMTATVIVGVRRPSGAAFSRAKARAIRRRGVWRAQDGGLIDPYYWRFMEVETGRANLAPRPFLRPALAAKREAALAAIRLRMSERLVAEAEKLGRAR